MTKSVAEEFLGTATKRLKYYKDLGDKAIAQLTTTELLYSPGEESNSIAVIVQHLYGNMMSRWTNFLTEDGEKSWRQRDAEFEAYLVDANQVKDKWEQGWNCLFDALSSLKTEDLTKIITIRGEGLSVVDAINRQLAHYPYHVGQIVFLARMIKKQEWKSLSIPKGQSESYNQSSEVKDPAKKF